MNQELDYNNIIITAKTNMNKRWNREDWMEDTIQDILEDWLTKNAQELGSEILSFTLHEIQQEVNKRHDKQGDAFDSNYLRYADTYFYVEKVISIMQDEADEQNVNLTVEQTTPEIYTIRLETKNAADQKRRESMKISMRGLVWLSMILLTVVIIACSIIFNFWRWLVVFYAITLLLTAYFFYQDAKRQK